MHNKEKYIEELSAIPKNELLYIFFNLLVQNKVSYTELSEVYTTYLEDKDKQNRNLICELGISLTMYKDKKTGGTWKQAEIKANKALVESRLFKGTEYEKKLIEQLEKK